MLNDREKLIRTLLHCCRLRFRRFPGFYFPVFVFLRGLQKLNYEIKLRTASFRVVPIPNLLFEQHQRQQLVHSEHTLFVSRTVFNQYVVEREINWINLIIRGCGEGARNKTVNDGPGLVSVILNKQNVSVLFQICPLDGVPPNVIFVKENLFHGLVDRYKLSEGGFSGKLQRIPEQQHLPQVATKANIFLYNTPYDLSSDMVDFIMGKFFENPQLLYRNHTYHVPLNERFLGNTFYTKNFATFAHLRSLYFKCLNLESSENSFELFAIVCKNLTNLHQTTTYNSFVPPQKIDDLTFVPMCPFGLRKYHDELGSSLTAYLKQENNSLIENQIHPIFMLQGERGIGKSSVLKAVASRLGIQVFWGDCTDIMTSISSQTETKLISALNKSKICEPIVIALQNFEIFGIDNEGHEELRILTAFQAELHTLFSRKYTYPVILIALSNEKDSSKPRLTSLFLDIIKFQSPKAKERAQLLRWIARKESIRLPLNSINKLSEQTQGFIFGDLKLLCAKASQKIAHPQKLSHDLFEQALEEMQASFSDSLGAPKVPKVLWSEIGGLAKLKTEIQNSIGLPLRHKKLLGKNMRRSGILLYGPPGTGKTLIAKAVATECNLSFLSVQGPELLNMYVGQSEHNVREVFSRARSAAPCVLFLDELDSLAPNRGVSGDSGGVMDRVVSQMLSEMDGISKSSDASQQIFILAATNRPDLIDPALLRPGRFDKLLYVGPSTTVDDKESVLRAITSRFHLTADLTLRKIAECLKQDMTGADMYSICSNAWLSAVRRAIRSATTKEENVDDTLGPESVVVNESDFKAAMKKFIPSISPSDMEYFNRLRSNFSV
ncbi:uncharacterized protein LOC129751616 isoform X2 [Uranotaenia lowii]|uniref:uncharacterized protein LOC129751616 isoform X2 n=1 Tax=Uranotaenia lowii TaxID=190385 RepID=UPI00247AE733|nr:uncharacterized protein LOC129751616 isoform X2 [Uranotaenia lowii]